ncbi:MAG: acyl-ACP--UDP-N-acetylglucosamine O-acyltransferase [Phycisphaerales bacterium]|nr:acyl-ACP--UDP-N-acetylglucosamine O-acyltransferase [Phycisphaerales bacterium]
MAIHSTAIIGKRVELDPTVDVGPYVIIEDDVTIGRGTRLYAGCYIATGTRMGADCAIHPHAVIGHHPQDLGWDGAPSTTEIGDGTVFREGAQVHRGTGAGTRTVVGKRCYIMANAHIAHNCVVGDEVKMANCALLAGHVHLGSRSFISGASAVHQFARLGELCMISGGTFVRRDVPSFMTFTNAGVMGVNTIGLRRAGLTSAERIEIRAAYRMLYRENIPPNQAREEVVRMLKTPAGLRLAEFLTAPSKRGLAASGYRRRSRFVEPGAEMETSVE